MASLHSLPVEVSVMHLVDDASPAHYADARCCSSSQLVLHIHLLALSPHLPTVSRYFHRLLSDEHNTSPLFRANWIQARLALEGIALASAAAAAARSLMTVATTSPSSSFASRSRRLRQYSSSAEASGQASTTPTAAERGSKIPQFLSHALRFPICGMDVLRILEDRCVAKGKQDALAHQAEQKKCLEEAMRLATPAVPPLGSSRTGSGRLLTPDEILLRPPPGTGADSADTLRPVASLHSLLRPRSIDVPKRLFRHISVPQSDAPSADSQVCARRDIDMLRHILDDLRGDPESHKGYPLAKAVLAGDMQLIRLLLDAGAHPGTKECMSIMLAIDKKDIEIVRTLIERGYYSGKAWSAAGAGLHLREAVATSSDAKGKGKKRKRSRQGADTAQEEEESPGKKRKLDRGPDRVAVTPAMLEAAVRKKSEPLIQYFMGKGE